MSKNKSGFCHCQNIELWR